ncbi:MAG: phospholipase D-like domain-containing protein [candidate division Zixibacteria bacterium]|nr:phospholipase D-like domain-containing protein [candidate division Zixibacteria bacterium]
MKPELFTNTNSRSDFVENGLKKYGREPRDVFIAVAFFTDVSFIQYLVDQGCKVRLIIRLGFPTSPKALGELMKIEGVEARYFSHHSFHPKLYIFGSDVALVGSANLTSSALNTNQEILITVDSSDSRFDDLASLFNDFWTQAAVLDLQSMQQYRQLYESYRKAVEEVGDFDASVIAKFKSVAPGNITRERKKIDEASAFQESYRKSFQECVNAIFEIRDAYRSLDRRKVDEKALPERLEIDGFISWIREARAGGDKWRDPIANSKSERTNQITALAKEWLDKGWKYFDDVLIPISYPQILKVMETKDNILKSTDSELFSALRSVHAFLETRRYHKGGEPTLQKVFFEDNEAKRLRHNLAYLVHGKDAAHVRMGNLIYNSDWKLAHFGRSCVQELVGWINGQDIPVVNGRTTKVLHYFGFKVSQLQ